MLNNLPKTTANSKRRGRGYGSGKGGHTVGRGQKGQKSRSGYKKPRPGFEGGQMPLSRRLPKFKGFRRAYFQKKDASVAVNLIELAQYSQFVDTKSKDFTAETFLKETDLNSNGDATKVKIIGKKGQAEDAKLLKENKELKTIVDSLVAAGATVSASVQKSL